MMFSLVKWFDTLEIFFTAFSLNVKKDKEPATYDKEQDILIFFWGICASVQAVRQ